MATQWLQLSLAENNFRTFLWSVYVIVFLCLMFLQGNLNELNVDNQVYLGGYPNGYNKKAGITTDLKGAIQRVRYNHCLVTFQLI